jgi:HK97 family phage major capsid protein
LEIEKQVADLNGAINKLIADVQTKHAEMENGRASKVAFDEFKVNTDKRYNELCDEVIKLKTPIIQASEADVAKAVKTKAFQGWLRKGKGGLSPEEQKVLTIADSDHAGVLAPYEYVQQIIKALTLYSPIRTVANVRQTSAYAVEFPTELTVPAATWIAESSEKTETTGLTYGLTELKTFEMAQLFKATQKMLEDSVFNLEAEISSVVGRKFGVLEGTAFYSGNGTTSPEGITINATVLADHRDVLTTDVLVFDDFIGTQYQLASPYVANATWLMNRTLLGVAVTLKSATTNMYLLQPNLQQGQPATILGNPVLECPDFPAITSTVLSTTPGDDGVVCALGDFRAGYTIVDRVDINIQRLVEKYAEFGMIGFLARRRVGGGVLLPEAIQLLKNIKS